jgi:hypothetical protein
MFGVNALKKKLQWSETLRTIHRRDTVEIEELLRITALPTLSRRPGREVHLSNLLGTNVCEALYIVANMEAAFAATEGDVCEFGVAQGATSTLMCFEMLETTRRIYLFDSFEGLPAPTVEDKLIDDIFNLGSMQAYQGKMRCQETEVLGRLTDLGMPRNRIEVRKGWVKDTIARADAPTKVAFSYVDLDFYEPIKDALVFLDTRMAPGARVVVDDYGFFSEGAQLATDDFVKASAGRWKMELPLPFAGKFAVLHKVSQS